MALFSFLKSTILSKVVMAVTGFIIVMYVVVHMIGNLQIYMGREVFNQYAYFLKSTGELLWIFRGVLLLSLILHIITSIRLYFLNKGARDVKYKVRHYLKAKLTARTMIWTGIAIFAFVTYHILHLTAGVTNPEHYNSHEYYETNAVFVEEETTEFADFGFDPLEEGQILKERHDVYYMVVMGFRNPLISLAYIVGVIIVGFHLSHAMQSMFQSVGVSGPRFSPFMLSFSRTLAVLIVLGYISIPVTVMLGLVGGCV